MSGKWHLTSETREPNDASPSRRRFDYFFGTLARCCSYYHPTTLFSREEDVEADALRENFFYTDAIADEASSFYLATS